MRIFLLIILALALLEMTYLTIHFAIVDRNNKGQIKELMDRLNEQNARYNTLSKRVSKIEKEKENERENVSRKDRRSSGFTK